MTTTATHLPGRLGNPELTLVTDPRLDPAMLLAVDGMDEALGEPPAVGPDSSYEEVVAYAKGTPIDSPFAVTSMDRDRLEAGGSPTWSDFFKKLGASRGVVGERSSAFNSNQFNVVASTVGNVNVRGLVTCRVAGFCES